jgi:hypothetical protein
MGPKGVPNGVYPPSQPRLGYWIMAKMVNIGLDGPEWSRSVQMCPFRVRITVLDHI